MSGDMLVYAMAHIAWHRADDAPDWVRFLRSALRSERRVSLRYLETTGDSSFKPVRLV